MTTAIQKTYGDVVDAFERKIKMDLDDGCNKKQTHLQIVLAYWAVSARKKLLPRSGSVQGFPETTCSLFSGCVANSLYIETDNKTVSSSTMNRKSHVRKRVVKKQHKSTHCPSSIKDDIDFNSVETQVPLVSFVI